MFRRAAYLAAFGNFLGVAVSFLGSVPGLYFAFEHPAEFLSQFGSFGFTAALQIANGVFFLAAARNRSWIRRAALIAAAGTGVSLALTVTFTGARWQSEWAQYRWLLGEVLGPFAWLVYLVQFVREREPLARVETRSIAAVLVITSVINAAWAVYGAGVSLRYSEGHGLWFAPETPVLRWSVVALWIAASLVRWLGPGWFFAVTAIRCRPAPSHETFPESRSA